MVCYSECGFADVDGPVYTMVIALLVIPVSIVCYGFENIDLYEVILRSYSNVFYS